jgi:hypothetical protein
MSPCMFSVPFLCSKLSCEFITTSSKTVSYATHFTCSLSSRLLDAGGPGLLVYLFSYFEAFHTVHSCSQLFYVFQLNAHNMLNTYIYHQWLVHVLVFVTPSSHLQGDHFVTCLNTACFLQRGYVCCALKLKIYSWSQQILMCYN